MIYLKPFFVSVFAITLAEYNSVMGAIAVTLTVFYGVSKFIKEHRSKKRGDSSNKFPEL